MTTPQRWKEIDDIFAAALEREPAERAAFLNEACAGDEVLRNEVESLLAHDTGESLVGSHASEQERMRRFRQEALAASALNHPNILTIYEIGEFESHNFIAAEFVDGVT